MENKKFRVITVKDENGNPVREFVPVEEAPEPECFVYGGYLWCAADKIQETKEVLLEQMIGTIRELAEKDNFWIVKDSKAFTDGPVPVVPENDCTVAWKIDFPQMYTQKPVVAPVKDYKGRMQDEYRQTKTRYDKLYQMCLKYEAGTLDFEPTCSLELLKTQLEAMGQYLHCLEVRAQIEGVTL